MTRARSRRRAGSIRAAVASVARGLVRDDAFHYAAGTAFRATLAIFPLLLGLLSVLTLLGAGERAGDALGVLGSTDAVPGETVDALQKQLDNLDEPGRNHVIGAVVAFAIALWSGAAAFRTIMNALDRALDLEDRRSAVRRAVVSTALAVLTATMVTAATLLVALGPAIAELIRDAPGGSGPAFAAWRLLSWPAVALLVFAWLATTYSWGPADRRPFRIVTPGIVVAFVAWFAFALAFSWYVDAVAQQGQLYGAFAGLVAFQLYVYWSALIVLVGAEVDRVLEQRGPRAEASARR